MQRPTNAVASEPVASPARPEPAVLENGPLAIVGGCGHVGLPLGIAFARRGYHVDLIDASAERVAQVNSGRMPFHEDEADTLLPEMVQSGVLKATSNLEALEDASAIIVTVGTPVDEYLD